MAVHPPQLGARFRRRVSGCQSARQCVGRRDPRVTWPTSRRCSIRCRSIAAGCRDTCGFGAFRWWRRLSFVAFVLRMPPVALAAVYLVYVAPRIILDFMIRRRRAHAARSNGGGDDRAGEHEPGRPVAGAGLGNGRQRNARAAGCRAPPDRPRIQARPAAGRSAPGDQGPAENRQLHAVCRGHPREPGARRPHHRRPGADQPQLAGNCNASNASSKSTRPAARKWCTSSPPSRCSFWHCRTSRIRPARRPCSTRCWGK